MSSLRPVAVTLFVVLATRLGTPIRVAAQDTALVRVDSTLATQDTVVADSAAPDLMPGIAEEVPLGPLAPGSRYVFTRDSMLWSYAVTVSDLLTTIPGVYVERGGFVGQPEYINYGGRGSTSIEIYWDGFLMPAMGGDTVYIDPSTIRLSYLRRMDVEVHPGILRIYLVSERHAALEPRSLVRITSGSFRTAEYAGLFQKRWRNGVSLNVAGDFLGSEGAVGADRKDTSLDLWAKLAWQPSPNVGAYYQIRFQDQKRDSAGTSPTVTPPQHGNRTDYYLGLFARTREDGFGLRVNLGMASSSWANDTTNGNPDVSDQTVRQGFLAFQYARPYLTLAASGRVWDTRNRYSVGARGNWMPLTGIILNGWARYTRHGANRTSRTGGATLGLYRGPFSLVGDITIRDGLQAPALPLDSAQRTEDAAARFGLETTILSGHVGVARRDAFFPLPPLAYPFISAMDTSVSADYIVADVRFRPFQPLTFAGWYSHPRTKPGDLQPPKHGRAEITFRSKFSRTFKSGIFDFKMQYALEYWSTGTAGFDATPSVIVLPGATFHRMFVQIQLVDFKIWWSLRNSRNSSAQYVPGLPYPGNAQIFGVRWEFFN